jgi:hypothetical protein
MNATVSFDGCGFCCSAVLSACPVCWRAELADDEEPNNAIGFSWRHRSCIGFVAMFWSSGGARAMRRLRESFRLVGSGEQRAGGTTWKLLARPMPVDA